MLTSDAHDLHGINFEEGYIAVVDKSLRWTSADVVRKVKFTLRKLGYRRSNRCNPIAPEFMTDISDAYESAYTIMLNLNKTWV